MKIIRFLFALTLTICLFVFINFKHGKNPPLGHFLNPFTGFWQNGESEVLSVPDVLNAPYLKDEVVIKFDEQSIPHIFANNDQDLYFAQGYIMAYHRLWQMEFQIMATEGRISEIIGSKALDFDRLKRRKGLKYAAKRSLSLMEKDPKIKGMMDAYTAGVNYWIEGLSYKNHPIEYKLLDYTPERWTNLKSAMLMKYMADMLSSHEKDLENTNLLSLLGVDMFNELFPDTYPSIDPVIPSERKWDFEGPKLERPDITFPQKSISRTIEKPDSRHGSNNFVVSQDRSNTGNVLLANEPDLSLNMPSIWYVMQLQAPGVNTFGAGIPGVPTVVVGFNDSIAWGVTNAKRDVVDWYAIDFRNEKREEYRYDDKWLKTEKVVEKILIRGEEAFYDTIVHTHYGPIVYDQYFIGNGNEPLDLAMKWTAHEESREMKAFYLLNRSKNYDDFVESISYMSAPAQNFAFGSTSGDIAMWVNGKFPIKWQDQGKFLMDGADSRQEWNGFIPHQEKAFIKNPEQGFVSSANQHPTDNTYPYYVYDYNYEFYRNRRINDRLKLLNNITVDEMKMLQNDNFNYRASESLQMMLDSLDLISFDDDQLKYYKSLSQWDYFNEPELQAPSIYEVWWDHLYAAIWDEFDDKDVALYKPNVFTTIHLMLNKPHHSVFDNDSTQQIEGLKDLIRKSFIDASTELNEWKTKNESEVIPWYQYKNTTVKHLLNLSPFSIDSIKVGGNKNIVNAASSNHGPSWRMVVELDSRGTKAWGVYPGSQSGNPGNPSYGQMIENWAKGVYYPLIFLKSRNEENPKIVLSQTLKPE